MENFTKQLNRIRDGLLSLCVKKYERLVRIAIDTKGDAEKNGEVIRQLHYLNAETTNSMNLPTKYVELAKNKRNTFRTEEAFRQELDMLYDEASAEAARKKSELNHHIK